MWCSIDSISGQQPGGVVEGAGETHQNVWRNILWLSIALVAQQPGAVVGGAGEIRQNIPVNIWWRPIAVAVAQQQGAESRNIIVMPSRS